LITPYITGKVYIFSYIPLSRLCISGHEHENSYPSSSSSLSFPLSSISLSSPFRLHPVFLPLPFLPSLSFRYIHSPCTRLSFISSWMAHSAPSFLSFHPMSVFSLLVPTSESRYHFSFSCTLSPQVLRNLLCYTPLMLPVVSGFFDYLPSFLLVCVFVPLTQLYIHPSFSRSQPFHFFTGIPVPLVVFLSLSLSLSLFFSVFFSFSLQHSVSIRHSSFPSILYLKLCRSLSRFHSQPIPRALFPHYVTWRFSVSP
jgi:hypothetical protein